MAGEVEKSKAKVRSSLKEYFAGSEAFLNSGTRGFHLTHSGLIAKWQLFFRYKNLKKYLPFSSGGPVPPKA